MQWNSRSMVLEGTGGYSKSAPPPQEVPDRWGSLRKDGHLCLSVFAPGHCLVLNLASKVIKKKCRPRPKRGVRCDLLRGKRRFSQGSSGLGLPKGFRVIQKVAFRLVLVLIAHKTYKILTSGFNSSPWFQDPHT